MQTGVLLVDDDQEVLLTLKEGLERYRDAFRVSIAGDGMIALEKLDKDPISVVVADLKMPRMDGFELLSHMADVYPDIPVIAITGYGTPAMQARAEKSGAVQYIPKPFALEDLARAILKALGGQSDGGSLPSVSSGTFLQLMELEQKTCTVRMVDKASGALGVLFFHNGELLDARCGGLKGLDAAYRIFSWDEVSLRIQNACPQKACVINSDLQPIILEAMRRKDEARADDAAIEEMPILEEIDMVEIAEPEEAGGPGRLRRIREALDLEFGPGAASADAVRAGDSYQPLVGNAERIGDFFACGEFRAAYLEREGAGDVAVLGQGPPVAVDVAQRCPRDRLLRLLGRLTV